MSIQCPHGQNAAPLLRPANLHLLASDAFAALEHLNCAAIYPTIIQQQRRALKRWPSAEHQAPSLATAPHPLRATPPNRAPMGDQHAGVIEVLEAPAAPAAASGVLARLAEREEARASAAAKRLQELQVSGDPRESVDAFMEEFAARRQQLEAALQAASGGSGGGDAAAVAALAEQIGELEKVGCSCLVLNPTVCVGTCVI